MTDAPRHLSSVPASGVDSATEEDPACRWPECAGDPAISPDGGETWWCWDHADDSALPAVEHGVLGACVRCRSSCATWWVRWPAREDVCLHDHCRRAHLMELAEGGAPATPAAIAPRSDVRGAYARRAARGS